MAASLLSFNLPKPAPVRPSAAAATAGAATAPDSLNDRFGRKGIKFSEAADGGAPTVELTVRNGSSVKLTIPDAHVTSYRPKVFWKDDGFEEVLYTVDTPSRVRGGVGLVINELAEARPASKGSPVAATTAAAAASEWTVKDADSDSIDAVQVELSRTSGTLEITYVVSLYPLSMATAVIVKNKGRKEVKLNSAILSHLRFKRRGGTAIQGLRGCSYCVHPPLSSPFELLSPAEAMKTESSGWFSSEPQEKPGSWTVQDELITILNNKLSRVYSAQPTERLKAFYNTSPSKYETVDQGRELFFRMIRMGFEDIYVASPGSFSEKYGKDYFICTGPASMLVPVVIKPGENWKGAQVIEHDNL
ncbi:hypothetical protein ACJRO7_007282 [Eucalyptus globulus]|uniref:Photosynthetic NDH subunit of subcomplex B 2, chloroplastic n=1 Tax=Eucalyptus globulus TaxID=34317 RepID=A0ABD3ILP3_EUCGL